MLDLVLSTDSMPWLPWTTGLGHRGDHCPGFNLNLLKLPSTCCDMAKNKWKEGIEVEGIEGIKVLEEKNVEAAFNSENFLF